MRISLGVEYNGKNYYGWQRQENLPTIQAQIETALSKVANHEVHVFCAGRTDVGVHAKEQVIHFDTNADRKIDAWILGGNSYLPEDIVIKWAKFVQPDFHARFSAIARRYRYLIYNNKVRPAILANQVAWWIPKLNVEEMQNAAKFLIGEHDFSSFRGSDCQSKTPMRNVYVLKIHKSNNLIIIDIKANAFLQHMVRNIAGLLMTIGEGKYPPIWAKEILEKRDRKAAPFAADADGLYLVKVYYS